MKNCLSAPTLAEYDFPFSPLTVTFPPIGFGVPGAGPPTVWSLPLTKPVVGVEAQAASVTATATATATVAAERNVQSLRRIVVVTRFSHGSFAEAWPRPKVPA